MQRTPLLLAVQKGQKQEVARLLRRKVSVSEADSDGVTPSMEAAANNHISILSTLLDAKADLNVVNRLGRSALIEGAARGHAAIVLRLCRARPILDYANTHHPLRLTALHEAASRGHDGVVFWLCEARADINKTNAWGDTPLIMAAHNNRLVTVQMLVAQRANTDVRGDGRQSALETALSQGHMRVAAFLSDPRTKDAAYLNELYSKFKAAQKDVLQDEVNYDASLSSRKVPVPGPVPQEYPEWEEALEPVAISGNGSASSSSSSSSSSDAAAAAALFQNTLKLTPNTPVSVRRVPLATLPEFGACQWIATEPTRTSRLSREEKISHFDVIIHSKETLYPVLTLNGNGSWSYAGDALSGELHGTFELFHIITRSSLAALERAKGPAPALEATASPFFYLVRLTTTPSEEQFAEGGERAPVQVVGFVLGRQIVLGRLVMEMSELAVPWWLINNTPAAAIAHSSGGGSSGSSSASASSGSAAASN